MPLSERLKIARESIGKNQKEMAQLCGASYRSWQGYEAGETPPKAENIEALVKLGFNANWLLTGEGEMRRNGAGAPQEPGGSPSAALAPPGGPEERELKFILLRDVIETYETMRPGRDTERKSREITIIYRHFLERFERHLDEVEIREYIDKWM